MSAIFLPYPKAPRLSKGKDPDHAENQLGDRGPTHRNEKVNHPRQGTQALDRVENESADEADPREHDGQGQIDDRHEKGQDHVDEVEEIGFRSRFDDIRDLIDQLLGHVDQPGYAVHQHGRAVQAGEHETGFVPVVMMEENGVRQAVGAHAIGRVQRGPAASVSEGHENRDGIAVGFSQKSLSAPAIRHRVIAPRPVGRRVVASPEGLGNAVLEFGHGVPSRQCVRQGLDGVGGDRPIVRGFLDGDRGREIERGRADRKQKAEEDDENEGFSFHGRSNPGSGGDPGPSLPKLRIDRPLFVDFTLNPLEFLFAPPAEQMVQVVENRDFLQGLIKAGMGSG
jgi:hypothetical protein